MFVQLFSVYDRVAMTYTAPTAQINRGCAVRWFTGLMHDSKLRPSDFDLMFVGGFDSENGVITAAEKPEYIMNGGEVEHE